MSVHQRLVICSNRLTSWAEAKYLQISQNISNWGIPNGPRITCIELGLGWRSQKLIVVNPQKVTPQALADLLR